MSVFPGAIPSAGLANPGDTLAVAGHTSLHNNGADEARAIAQKLGTGASTPSDGQILKGNGVGTSAWGTIDLETEAAGVLPLDNTPVSAILEAAYPVGSIYINAASSTNPSTLLGFGVWVAFAAGKVLVGLDSGQTEFDSPGETGGEKTHTLTTAEMPAHTHPTYDNSSSGVTSGAANSYLTNVNPSGTNTGSTGGGGAHNNLQPYVVVYMFRRTA